MKDNKKNGSKIKPDLSWKLIDYIDNGKEPPDRIKENPTKTEGQLMSEEEIREWFLETIRVLKVLKEDSPEVFQKLYDAFFLDLEYLFSLSRIDEEALEFAQDVKNFDFF